MCSKEYKGFEIIYTKGDTFQVHRGGSLFSEMHFASPLAAQNSINSFLDSIGKGEYPLYKLSMVEVKPIQVRHIFKMR